MLQQTYIFGSWAESWNACFLAVSQTSAEISYAQILQRLYICLLLIAISNIFENIISTEAATNWITLKWCILGLNIAQIGWCVSWGAMEHLWSMYKLVINFFFWFYTSDWWVHMKNYTCPHSWIKVSGQKRR